MSKRLLIRLIALIALVVALWWVWPREEASITMSAKSVQKTMPTTVSILVPTVQTNQVEQGQRIPTLEEQAQFYEEKQARYLKKAQEVSKELNRPMVFYGQVLDQDSKAVAGVQIDGHYSFFDTVMPGPWSEKKKVSFTTDADGRFEFKGERGLSLQLQILPREDYEFKSKGFLLVPFQAGAPAMSASDKPYIFHAYKKGLTEPLVQSSLTLYDCMPDGRWYTVDLKNRRNSENGVGDFRISLTRFPGRMGHIDMDWSVRIEGINMELVESQDEFMYQAPENGYQASWSYFQQANQPGYKREVSSKFYMRMRDGSMYGRVEMIITADYREGYAVQIHYWLNPAGSRNLQDDPNKRITPQRIAEVGLEKAIQEMEKKNQNRRRVP